MKKHNGIRWTPAGLTKAAEGVTRLLEIIGEDPGRDGLKDTPKRVVRALMEMTSGYAQDPGKILGRVFKVDHDEMVTLDHIRFSSLCEHHMLPFHGVAHIGYIPTAGKVVGISKLARLVECYAKRLQVQERMAQQVARAISEHLRPTGVAVLLEAQHGCMGARGIHKPDAVMRTSVMLGAYRSMPSARAEFFSLVGK